MAGSPTAAWLPKRPELAPADVSGPRFASPVIESRRPTSGSGRATRPFRFGSEDRPDPDPPLGVGSVIGDRYRIVSLLGEGGMGRVYEAEHIVLRRKVALKLLRRDAASEAENLARFRQEALAASRIGAPEIVEVVDFASHPVAGGQQTYMVMELLVGESLEDWMDRNARLDEGLTILASLCDGLAAAHRAAVVHRDIKPANVFLPAADPTRSSQTLVKILDFGIAKITAGGEGFQTRQGSLLGTPYYLAPERVMGAELTGAADLYSVGVILYEMLTGNVPFVADSFMGILANHVHTAPLDPRQAAPERPIPAAVAQLCMRLLDKQPGQRPSAEAVAIELRRLLGADPATLAGVEIGPRGAASAGTGLSTQVIADVTRELATPEHARSVTQIGHGSAASTMTITTAPELAPSSRRSAKLGLGLGLLASGALAIVLMMIVGREDRATIERAPSPSESVPATIERAREPITIEQPAIEQPTVEQPTVEQPAIEPEPTAAPSDERDERDERDAVEEPAEDRKRTRKPKPIAENSDVPKPPVDPPPTDAPKQKPEAGPELPTIKDDVYSD